MVQQAWTLTEIEEFEVIELPTREAFTGLTGGLITVDLNVCLNVDVNVDADVNLGGDCDSSSGGGGGNGGNGGNGGKCK